MDLYFRHTSGPSDVSTLCQYKEEKCKRKQKGKEVKGLKKVQFYL